MAIKEYDKKYGFDSSGEKVKSLHASRQMFAIKDKELYLAPANVTYSHAVWFESKDWIKPGNDSSMDKIIRGYFDSGGVYFYKGYDFIIDEESERIMISKLPDLIKKASIDINLHLYGGKIKQKTEGKWPPKKDYGLIRNLL